MPWPRVLVIEEYEDGVFLDRFTSEGETAGDTWHESIGDAQAQAAAEYEGMLTPWLEIPAELTGEAAIGYALLRARLQ